ncbi:hypothetical protein [Waltera sp.]|uniref:hypothetical protein n=1 Tax=Waltera sp. TaxID=2815806 RepID=UPI003990CD4D
MKRRTDVKTCCNRRDKWQKFRYSLQNILNIKEKWKHRPNRNGMAQTALNVEIEHLERLKARKREYEEESGGLLQGN